MKEVPKKISVKPGAFKSIPPAARQKIMREFIHAVQDGTLLKKSRPVDMERLRVEEPEVYDRLMESLGEE